MQESLQLQHSTNLNIQRSQSTQRFTSSMTSSNEQIPNQNTVDQCAKSVSLDANDDVGFSGSDTNYFTNWGKLFHPFCHFSVQII